jgi:hypothetical protein
MTIKVQFRREKEEMLTNWELSNFLNTVSSSYYRNELLKLVVNELKNGTDARNIVILDNSFLFDKSYEDLGDIVLSDSHSLEMLYKIGKPISMLPNENVFHIYIIFDTFSSINRVFYSRRIPRMGKFGLPGFTDTQKNIDDCLDNVKEYAMRRVTDYEMQLKLEKKKEIKDFSTTRKRIEEIVERAKKHYATYLEDEELRKEFIEEAEKEKPNLKQAKYSRIKTQYFMPFFSRFDSLSRPVVCIYSQQENKISILGINHINRKKRDKQFFDIKRISHESPISILISATIGLAIFLQFFIEKRKQELLLNRSITDLERAELEYLERFNNLKTKIDQLPRDDIADIKEQIYGIENDFIREEMERFNENNIERNYSTLDKYDLTIDNVYNGA